MIRILILVISVLSVTACSPYPIMPPVTYHKPINLHTNKSAWLTWGSAEHHYDSLFSYSKAEQVVFVTSVRDVLKKNRVFKNVNITPIQKKLKNNEIQITLFFKKTEIEHTLLADSVKIDLIISVRGVHGEIFKRYYFSRADKVFFKSLEMASQQLMNDIVHDLAEWANM